MSIDPFPPSYLNVAYIFHVFRWAVRFVLIPSLKTRTYFMDGPEETLLDDRA